MKPQHSKILSYGAGILDQFQQNVTDSGTWAVGTSGVGGMNVSVLEFTGGGSSTGATFSVAADGN